jgi:hypothetical protein
MTAIYLAISVTAVILWFFVKWKVDRQDAHYFKYEATPEEREYIRKRAIMRR